MKSARRNAGGDSIRIAVPLAPSEAEGSESAAADEPRSGPEFPVPNFASRSNVRQLMYICRRIDNPTRIVIPSEFAAANDRGICFSLAPQLTQHGGTNGTIAPTTFRSESPDAAARFNSRRRRRAHA